MTENNIDNNLVSIVTPTYNRGKMLKKLYGSLTKQSKFNFEWIIIDDGSDDDTQNIVQNILNEEKKFPVKLEIKKNGGKHTALNESQRKISGNWVVIIDSDDFLLDHAMEKINDAISNVNISQSEIIIFNRINNFGKKLGHSKNNTFHGSYYEYLTEQKVTGDHTELIKTEVFKKYKLPTYPLEKFMSEGWLLKKIAIDGVVVTKIDENIVQGEYLGGGLTSSGKKIHLESPLGMIENSRLNILFANNSYARIKAILLFNVYRIAAKKKYQKKFKYEEGNRFLAKVLLIPAYVLFKYWNRT